MSNKKAYFIIIGLVALVVLILSVFISSTCSKNAAKNDKTIEMINTDRSFFANYIKDKNKIYYASDKGIVWYQYDLANNQKTKLQENEILGAEKIIYRPNGDNAIVFSNYPYYNVKHYDFTNNEIYNLNENINSAIWANTKKKIYYTYFQLGGPTNPQPYVYNISEADYDGKNWKTIKDFTKTDYIDLILYPAADENYLYYLARTTNGSTLYKLNINDKKEEAVTQENIITSNVLFSPDKSKIIFIDKNNMVTLQSLNNKDSLKQLQIKDINISQLLWANDNNTLYFMQNLNNLVVIDTQKGSQKEYKLNSTKIDTTEMLDDVITALGVNEQSNTFYLTYNNYLYKINLN